MSLSQALSTAISGLRTTQAGMALVASNVANAQTPGYVRKTLTQVTTSAGGTSAGVRTSGVARELDQYLQRSLQTETSGASYADLRASFYQRMQSIYGDPGSSTALETLYSNFTTALQTLTTNPSDYAAQSGVVSSAQILAGQLNTMTDQMQSLRSDAEQGLSDAVNTANNALTQIASLNQKLAGAGVLDATSATLADQRDAYITQLSQLMDIRVVAGDHNQLTVFTGSGIQLVGGEAAQLSFNEQGTVNANAVWDADPAKSGVGSLQLVLPTGGKYDLVANHAIRSGTIAAYLDMRDNVLVQGQTQLDGFAAALSQALSSKTEAGTAATSLPATGFDVNIGDVQPGDAVRFTYTDTATGKVHNVSVVRVEDPGALPLTNAATIDPNDEVIGVSFSGGAAGVAAALSAKFGSKLQFSDAGGALRILNDGAAGNTSVSAASAVVTETALSGGTPAIAMFTDSGKPYSGAIDATGSQLTGYAGRIAVNLDLVADPSKLVSYASGTAVGDATRPNFIYNQLMSAKQSFAPATGIGTSGAPYSGTISDYLRQVISRQGEAASNADAIKQGQDVVLNSLQQRFNDASGVNIDQEMANLLSLQNAYGANARVMSVVKDMFDTLLQVL